MREPTWLDTLIQTNITAGAPAIAQAVATSPQVIAAIETALARPVDKRMMGPSKAQKIGDAIIQALQSRG
jgi:hypothetical protein